MKNHRGTLTKLVVALVRMYSWMPVKPFRKVLRNLYSGYFNSADDRSVVIKRIDGIDYELDLREVIDNAMYWQGSREPDTSRLLKLLCRRGDVVFDIGANTGSHALPMASYVGDEGRVYAFEPVPWAMRRMQRNLELNSFRNITLELVALSDEKTEMEMKFRASFRIGSASGVGLEGKIDESWWNECEQVRVRIERLDDYVADHGIDRLDLIKLDVDGFEGKVLRGAKQTLRRFKPYIIMEVAPAWTEMRGDSVEAVLDDLMQAGYLFYQESDLTPIPDLLALARKLPRAGGINVLASARGLEDRCA